MPTFEMTADDAKVFRSFAKMEGKIKTLEGKLKMVGRAGEKAGKKTQKAFGKNAASGVKSFVTGLLGGAGALAAINKVTAALKEMQQMRDDAGRRVVDAATGKRYLYQISSDAAQARQLITQAERIRTERGIDEGAAYRIVGQAGSAGARFVTPENLDLLASLQEIAFAPEAGIEATQKLQAAFGGTGEGKTGAGTLAQIVNKVIAAAGPSPVNAAAIARAMSMATTSFEAIGGQDEGLLAFGAVLSEVFKTPEAAAERVKSLADQISKKMHLIDLPGTMKDIGGLELIGKLDELAEGGRLLSEKGEAVTVDKFLSESNALQAMRAFRKMEGKIFERREAVIQAEETTGTEGDLLGQRLGMVRGDPGLSIIYQKKKIQERREQAEEERWADVGNLAQTIIDEFQIRSMARGRGQVRIWAERKSLGMSRLLMGDRDFVEAMRPSASPETQVAIDRQFAKLDAAADKLLQAAEAMDRVADKQGGGPALLEEGVDR